MLNIKKLILEKNILYKKNEPPYLKGDPFIFKGIFYSLSISLFKVQEYRIC